MPRKFDDLLRSTGSQVGASGISDQEQEDELVLTYGTEEEQRKYLELRRLSVAYTSPLSFALYTTPGTQEYPHTVLLDRILTALVENRLYKAGPGPEPVWVGDNSESDEAEGHWEHPSTGEEPVQFLAIAMPPRHGKSFVVSQHLPAWYIGKYPDRTVALASYSEDFSAHWGGLNRDHFVLHPELGIQVKRGKNAAATDWNTTKGGGMRSIGVGGGITGLGFPLMVVDDPIKNSEEAQSEANRTKQHNWWTSTWITRQQPYDKVMTKFVLMFTRWHEDDLAGRVVFDDAGEVQDGWYYLHLPALALDDDPLGREPGEPLCSARFSRRQLEDIRDNPTAAIGWWDSLYQGAPFTIGAGITAGPFQTYSVLEIEGEREYFYRHEDILKHWKAEQCFRFATVDLAGTAKTVSDWNVMSVYDYCPDGTLLHIGQERTRLESADHLEWVKKAYDYWRCQMVAIEDRTFGTTLLQRLKRDPKYLTFPLKADTDKVTRAIPYGAAIARGLIRFPAESPSWWAQFVSEHVAFPNGTHDDQVDTGAYAYRYIATVPRTAPPVEPDSGPDAAHLKRIQGQVDRHARARRYSGLAGILGLRN